MDCSLPGSSIHGLLQARVLEWVAISFSRGASRRKDQTRVFSIAGRSFTLWDTREARKQNTRQSVKNPLSDLCTSYSTPTALLFFPHARHVPSLEYLFLLSIPEHFPQKAYWLTNPPLLSPCQDSPFFFFNWSIIALQCCVSFSHATKQVSYMYTYIPSLWDHPPSYLLPIHLYHQE